MKKLNIKKQRNLLIGIALSLTTVITGCNKLVELGDNPLILSPAIVFSDSAGVQAALAGVYSSAAVTLSVYSSDLAVNNGLYTDELTTRPGNLFEANALFAQSPLVENLWSVSYNGIYAANSVIEGAEVSTGINASVKAKAIGEAKFLRAFFYYYLVNHYGDMPLVLSTTVSETKQLPRSKVEDVYKQIILDLNDAVVALSDSYPTATGDRLRANKYVAAALLSKACLQTGDWVNAESAATMVIDQKALYDTVTLTNVFYTNSMEAIFQIQGFGDITNIAGTFTPSPGTQPFYIIRNSLLNAFEAGDLRKTIWINYSAGLPYPAKYRSTFMAPGTQEYYTLLRLADIYLVRAEARAHRNLVNLGNEDLNLVRKRARLTNTVANDQTALLTAVEKERRVELFCETGDRFYDLRRTGRIDAVLGAEKPGVWKTAAKLYPVPAKEIAVNPNLKPQNPGYTP